MLGLRLSIPCVAIRAISSLESQIAALFANGEQGAWYDPSDFSTMFQDSAGTTPVTAVEQPVGLILDKSKGLVLGSELVTNGDFSNGTTGLVVFNGAVLTIESGRLKIETTGAGGGAYFTITTVIGKKYKVIFSAENGTGVARLLVGTGIPNSANVSALDGTRVAQNVYFTATATTTYVQLFCNSAAGLTAFFDNISVKELAGNHASQATATSRPVLKVDGNGKYYMYFDGVDDSLATAAIDFTATDKMTVWAGLTKSSDAATAILCELSASYVTNAASFYVSAPNDAGSQRYASLSRGAAAVSANQGSYVTGTGTAPDTCVLTTTHNIAGDSTVIRRNATEFAAGTVDKGSGNFGNYALYIGRRGGATLPFNGNLYSLIIRGAASTPAQIASGEQYAASKTGVTL